MDFVLFDVSRLLRSRPALTLGCDRRGSISRSIAIQLASLVLD